MSRAVKALIGIVIGLGAASAEAQLVPAGCRRGNSSTGIRSVKQQDPAHLLDRLRV